MIIVIILWLKLCLTSELWSSGVIETQANYNKTNFDSDKSQLSSSGIFGGFLQPIFGQTYEGDEGGYNFVQANLPIRKRIKRILFVTPGIAKENPEAVKETFFRLYCNLIGILLRVRELTKFTRGTFFALKPLESRNILKNVLNEFEKIFGIKLFAAMIDLGPDCLPYALKQEFNYREIEMFRHPSNMINEEIYYIAPLLSRNSLDAEIEEYSWLRNPLVRGHEVFKIKENYPPIFHEIPKMTREKQIDPLDTKEIVEALEKIYGPLEEISLADPIVETVSNEKEEEELDLIFGNLFHLEENCEEKEDEEEYEIIKSEDYKWIIR